MNRTITLRTITSNVKKAAITMALLLTLGASYAFNGTHAIDEVSTTIRTSFKNDFRHAQLLSSEAHKTFTKLTFEMDGQILSAYYTENGDLLATTHNIVSTQLPLPLLMSLKNDYKSYWITELFEFSGYNENCYYISLENADGKISLRSNGDSWEVYSSVKK